MTLLKVMEKLEEVKFYREILHQKSLGKTTLLLLWVLALLPLSGH